MAKNRDEFGSATKLAIAKRAGWLCSNPSCRNPTVGATSDGKGEINIGTAAHITAAAPGGPRYDPNLTREERRSAENGIWMCRDHGKAVDSPDPQFTVELLREWKAEAQAESWRRVLRNDPPNVRVAASGTPLTDRLRATAEADLEVFRRTRKWPATSVALTLRLHGMGDPASTTALANAVTSLDDLILVAPPGMGKTTTLFQIAEGVLAHKSGTPLVVLLGDWATEGKSLLESILSRPAFSGISEADVRRAASEPGVVLLLDGWNELDGAARKRATVQVEALKAELPELGLLISTRRQALDVPFSGTRVDLLPLNEAQQLEIATAMRGDAGARIVDQAWRTSGVRELVTIPLYLTTLLALPDGASFPTTKEEVLRHFVAAHEADPAHAEALGDVPQGLHQQFLDGLADFATRSANTAVSDTNARKCIADTESVLVANGQITIKPQPNAVLDVLVSHHVLTRTAEAPGYSFQHQQFQEWYASHSVERLMLAAVGDAAPRRKLKAEVFNDRQWEEATLFAIERLARGGQDQQRACGAAILAAFGVDPLFAAEMIFRATEEVWASISAEIQRRVGNWHTRGKIDRALQFMITSGRSEFRDVVWPLIADENKQVSLSALRVGKRFRPSLLGSDAATRIASLAPQVRGAVLNEIASNSGMDGLDLATAIAKADSDPAVKATVVDALAFRRADRHVAELLSTADDATYDLVAARDLIDDVPDANVQRGLEAARERKRKAGLSHRQRLWALASDRNDGRHDAEVKAIVAEMEIDSKRDGDMGALYEASRRYPRAFAEGLLSRVRHGRGLFRGADDILASAGLALDDDELVEIALANKRQPDDRAEAAASAMGPVAVGRLIDAYLSATKRIRAADGRMDSAASDRSYDLRARIAHTPGASLIAAVQARAAAASCEEIADLAGLLSRDRNVEGDRARPFSADGLAAISALLHDWGEKILAAGSTATRGQISSLATLMSHAPSVALLPLLKRLLDEELRRYRAFREEAKANNWRPGAALNEARTVHTHAFQRAFLAINAPETGELAKEYLADEHFGSVAARVLALQWIDANEPKDRDRFGGGVDFTRVAERRAARAADPTKSSAEAEAIFRVVDTLIADGSTDDQKKLAVELGTVALRLPHGQREATIEKLIALAPRRARSALLQNLVLSGADVDVDTVAAGVAEVLVAAEKDAWILTQADGYELKEWLLLLPFVNRPAGAIAVVRSLPEQQRNPRFLEGMVAAIKEAPSPEAEEVLFTLAEEDPRFFANHDWRDAVLKRGTLSAAQRFTDLIAEGALDKKSNDDWHLARQIGELMDDHPELRAHVYNLLTVGHGTPHGLGLLARAVAENPDTEGLLLLVRLEIEQKRAFVDLRTVERAITEQVPDEEWKGAYYNVVPVPAPELRKRLLEMTTSGGADDPAARCLTLIDKTRDRYGEPETEPRHPDLESGRSWPIMTHDPEAEAA